MSSLTGNPVRWGVLGVAKIATKKVIPAMQKSAMTPVMAIASRDLAKAQEAAASLGIGKAYGSYEELLADPAIEIVINLTIPQAHAPLNERILRAGKHAYTEKPFALDVAESRRVLALAKRRNLLVGSAPDTFLGGGIQTARQLLDDGAIGRPLAATAYMLCRGHESWHPAPEFYYQRGGGPMFDMGPYYVTALVNLLGPVSRVSAVTKASCAADAGSRKAMWSVARSTRRAAGAPASRAAST